MAAEGRGLRLLVVAQPARAEPIAKALAEAAPGRFDVACARPEEVPERPTHDAFVVCAACAGKDLPRLMERAPASVVLSDGEIDPSDAAASGAALVLPAEVPANVLASALLSTVAWRRDEATLRDEREHLLHRLVASERTASMGTLSAGIAH